MNEIWFSSDLHHYHKNIQTFCAETRPKGTLDEMTDHIIEAHNSVVKPGDEFWHLGDFSFGTEAQTAEVLSRMNGKLRFIRGNHDKVLDKSTWCQSFLSSYDDYKGIKIGDTKVYLFHYPIESWNCKFRGSIHLHGHLHGDKHHECRTMINRYDVGSDNRGDALMIPLNWDQVRERIKAQNELITIA